MSIPDSLIIPLLLFEGLVLAPGAFIAMVIAHHDAQGRAKKALYLSLAVLVGIAMALWGSSIWACFEQTKSYAHQLALAILTLALVGRWLIRSNHAQQVL